MTTVDGWYHYVRIGDREIRRADYPADLEVAAQRLREVGVTHSFVCDARTGAIVSYLPAAGYVIRLEVVTAEETL